MRLDLKKMVQHQVYTPNFVVTYQGQKSGSSGPTFWGPMIDTILLGVIFRLKPRYLVQT